MKSEPTVLIVLSWYNHTAYVSNIEPQNDTWASDNLLRSQTYDKKEAMHLPQSVAELIISQWDKSCNYATPSYSLEVVN